MRTRGLVYKSRKNITPGHAVVPTFRRGWERRLAVAGVGQRRRARGWVGGKGERREGRDRRDDLGLSRPTSGELRGVCITPSSLPLIDPSSAESRSLSFSLRAKNPRQRPPAPTRVRRFVAHQVVDTRAPPDVRSASIFPRLFFLFR